MLTVYENIEYPLLMVQKVPPAERQKRVTALLEAVGMADQKDKYPDQISGGQKQRVAVARALVTNPKLVLADEPTANLDHQTAYMVINLMKKMRDEFKTTFIFSTHDQKIVGEAEIIFTLEDGELNGTDRDEGRETAMGNLFKIAIRNLLRYKRRTLLTASLITIGVVFVLVFVSVSGSFKNMMIGQITDSMLGHLQVHRKGFVASIETLPLNLNLKGGAIGKLEKILDAAAGDRGLLAAAQVRRHVQQLHRDDEHPAERRSIPEKEFKTVPLLPGRIIGGQQRPATGRDPDSRALWPGG